MVSSMGRCWCYQRGINTIYPPLVLHNDITSTTLVGQFIGERQHSKYLLGSYSTLKEDTVSICLSEGLCSTFTYFRRSSTRDRAHAVLEKMA